MTRKIVFITLACSLLIAYGVMQRQLDARSGGQPAGFDAANVDVGVKAPSGSKFVRSYESRINGVRAKIAHYVSALPAQRLVQRFMSETAGNKPVVPALVHSTGCAAAGYADGSDVIGVVAMNSPSGCSFFISRAPAKVYDGGGKSGDVPGADAPGIPRPIRSSRTMSVEDLGGVPSVLAFYEGWGPAAEQASFFRREMAGRGWRETEDFGRMMSEQMDGDVLSFTNGTKRCMIYIEKEPRSGKLVTTVLYRVKDWLPAAPAY